LKYEIRDSGNSRRIASPSPLDRQFYFGDQPGRLNAEALTENLRRIDKFKKTTERRFFCI